MVRRDARAVWVSAQSAVAVTSFGGLVALEAARREPTFEQVFVYEPGVPIRGQLSTGWFDEYERRLASGDRRGHSPTW